MASWGQLGSYHLTVSLGAREVRPGRASHAENVNTVFITVVCGGVWEQCLVIVSECDWQWWFVMMGTLQWDLHRTVGPTRVDVVTPTHTWSTSSLQNFFQFQYLLILMLFMFIIFIFIQNLKISSVSNCRAESTVNLLHLVSQSLHFACCHCPKCY